MNGLPVILALEPDREIAGLLRFALAQAGFEPTVVPDESALLEQARALSPSVLLVDSSALTVDGAPILPRLRHDAVTAALPMIVVRRNRPDQEAALTPEDGCVVRPYEPAELIAEIRRVLRRTHPHRSGQPVRIGDLTLDPITHSASLGGRLLPLGPTEFDLLLLLINHPGRVFSREQLMGALRGDASRLEGRTIDVYIRRLRLALGPQGEHAIATVRGAGYKLVAPPTAHAPTSDPAALAV